jgi:hypothetical protein
MQLRAAFWLCSPGLAIRWTRGQIARKGVAVPVPRAPDPPPEGRPRVPLRTPTRDFSPDTSSHEELASENALPRAQVALRESKIADVGRNSRPTSPRGSISGTRAPSPLPGTSEPQNRSLSASSATVTPFPGGRRPHLRNEPPSHGVRRRWLRMVGTQRTTRSRRRPVLRVLRTQTSESALPTSMAR